MFRTYPKKCTEDYNWSSQLQLIQSIIRVSVLKKKYFMALVKGGKADYSRPLWRYGNYCHGILPWGTEWGLSLQCSEDKWEFSAKGERGRAEDGKLPRGNIRVRGGRGFWLNRSKGILAEDRPTSPGECRGGGTWLVIEGGVLVKLTTRFLLKLDFQGRAQMPPGEGSGA